MKLTGLHNVLSLAFVLFCSLYAASQEKTRVEARIDRDSILIGQQITLSLLAEIPETEPIRFFSVDTIDHFEFIQKGEIDTANTAGGTRLMQEIVITSFDSGQFVIPAFIFDAERDIKTDSFLIDVSYSPFDPQQDYHKVKDIIEVETEKKENHLWMFIAGGALLLLIALFFLLKKKKAKPEAVVPVNPYEKAMKALNDLNPSALTPKEYYSRLTDIFREYLSEAKKIHSLQKTTDDLVVQLRSLNIEKSLFDSLSQSLRLCDFVKFAKYIPGKEDGDRVFEAVKSVIIFLEKDKMAES